MGFNSVDDVFQIAQNGQLITVPFYRVMPSTTTANFPHTMYTSTGFPIFGATTGIYPAVSKTAQILSQSNTGSIPFPKAGTGMSNHLVGWSATPNSQGGTFMLVDRIVQCQLSQSETNGSFTGFSAVDRLSPIGYPGSGAQIWCEVSNVFGGARTIFYFTYTNQDGTGSRTTPQILTRPLAVVGSSILQTSGTFIPLQDSDTGVRSIESITMVSASGPTTGRFCAALVKPIAFLSYNQNATGVANHETDFVTQIPAPEEIHDDAFLTFISWITAAATYSILGQLRFAAK